MNIVKAKFKGRDGSLGYKTGGTYKLLFSLEDNNNTFRKKIFIEDVEEVCQPCVYSNLKTFLDNWEVVG